MRSGRRMLSKLAAVMLLASALTGGAYACASCGGGGAWAGAESMGVSWADQLLGSTASGDTASEETASEGEGAQVGGSNETSPSIAPSALFADRKDEQRMVMAYVGVPGEGSFIEGSIQLPLEQVFADNGTLKSPEEIALLFGTAGISEVDPLVIYGDDFVYQSFAFWVMKYLGHQDVVLLEGTRADWEAAGLEFVATPAIRPPAVYNPAPNLDLLAGDDDLAGAQLVDARSPEEYAAGHREGAINIDSATVMGAGGLADDEALASAFSGLNKESPVVVYSTKGGQASIVWYALSTHGYEASLFTLGQS